MKRKRKTKGAKKLTFFVVAILILVFAYTAFFGVDNYYGDNRTVYVKGAEDITWGIDIRGGVEAIFEPNLDANSDIKLDEITQADMDSIKEVMEARLLAKGITESEVRTDLNNKQVIVRFPWQSGDENFDPTAAVKELGNTAVLTFCEGSEAPASDKSNIVLQGADDIASAAPGYDRESGGYIVQLELTKTGASKFAAATSKLSKTDPKGVISIWLEGSDSYICAPTVNDTITDGNAIISGDASVFTPDYVNELASIINAGSIPFSLKADDNKLQIISPTLGTQALNVMTIAGIAAFIVICIVMILMFRLPGVVTSIALLGQVAGMLACSSGFFDGTTGVTLTIPGIAGIILSIGMGVDANVIASERIREEFRKGKTIDGAISAGFENSFNAVLDGNVTVFIVSAIMMGAFGTTDTVMGKLFYPVMQFFGSSVTGSIYSFGYTLLIGVIFNMIMGVYFSRAMLRSISRFKFLRKPWLYGGAKNAK
ncbi:MAG: MMPL family transporter [Clostridia bacterium]|nr:MMPL family transporter [Clostridia bacterium]